MPIIFINIAERVAITSLKFFIAIKYSAFHRDPELQRHRAYRAYQIDPFG